MKILGFSAASVLLCLATMSGAQSAGVPTKAAQLSKIVLDPDIPKENQHVKVGTICLFSGGPLDFGSGERTIDYERFERLFSAMMEKRGLNVVAKSSDMFEGEGDGPEPEFLIGATIRPQSIDICDSVNGQKGTIAVAVEWQIFDREKKRVVDVTTTHGEGKVPKFQTSGLKMMFDDAFSANLAALIDQGTLQKYLGGAAPGELSAPDGQVQEPQPAA